MDKIKGLTTSYNLEVQEELGSKVTLNFGPQHPATHGTLRLIIELDGENISSIVPEIGYLHSGFEKQMEYMTYDQCVTVTDRMNYMSSICNNIGFALAVEAFMGIATPPRCSRIRTILYELGRIQDHIVCAGLQAMDLGAFSVMLWAFIEREKVYDILIQVTGGRLTTSYTRIGGLARDVPDDFVPTVKKFIDGAEKILDQMEGMLTDNQIFVDRTKNIGTISKEDAISFGLTGPLLRACGVEYDIRKARPYLDYSQFDFNVITEQNGDSYARYKVRIRECRESIRIIRQAIKDLPKGNYFTDDHRITLPPKDTLMKTPSGMSSMYSSIEALIFHFKHFMFNHGIKPPIGDFYYATESPNGELGFYIVSDGTHRPFRMRIRPPSFYNYQSFTSMTKGLLLSDLVSILSSLNIIAGELDR
ncbi:MAG: NADH dehydrogenase (quinone) subunit D [Planctomycetes bacterium]|nr:NADH dehydrogenase (quinone) subunit D [Planctomycetota bacterium]